jgi:thiamine-phosphate pyrophosphorylase
LYRDRFLLPPVYPITDTRISRLSHVEQVRRFIDGGARLIQLREKYGSPREFFADAAASVEYAHSKNVLILINDRVDIALAAGADGVHIGQTDMPPTDARGILGENAIIGYSTHSVAQAREAARMPIDYAAIGPVFATSTKEDPDDVVGLDGVSKARAVTRDLPLTAIGGITYSSAERVIKAGADSVALISSLLDDPENIGKKYETLLNRLHNIVQQR